MSRLCKIQYIVLVCLMGCRSHVAQINEIPTPSTDKAWWSNLHDPLAMTLVEKLLAQNPSIQYSQSQFDETLSQTGVAYASLLPDVQAIGSTYNIDNQLGSENASLYNASANINAQWALDVFGGRRAQYASSRAFAQYRYELIADTRTAVIQSLLSNIIQWRQAQEYTTAAHELIKDQMLQVSIYNAKVEAGLSDATSLLRAQALLHETETILPNAENAMLNAQYAIEALIGVAKGELDEVFKKHKGPLELPLEISVAEIQVDILKSLPVMKALEANLVMAEADVRIASANRWPQLNVEGSWGFATGSAYYQLGKNPVQSLTLGLLAPLLNFGSLQSSLDAARERYVQASLQYDIKLLSVVQTAQSARAQYIYSWKMFEAQEKGLLCRKSTLKLLLERFKHGLTDIVDVTTAQSELNQSLLTWINYKAQTVMAYVNYKIATSP